jgi:hypothetical protein
MSQKKKPVDHGSVDEPQDVRVRAVRKRTSMDAIAVLKVHISLPVMTGPSRRIWQME